MTNYTPEQVVVKKRIESLVRDYIHGHLWDVDAITDIRHEADAVGLLTIDQTFDIIAKESRQATTQVANVSKQTGRAEAVARILGFAVEYDNEGQLVIYTDLFDPEKKEL